MTLTRRRLLVITPFPPRRDARHGGRLTAGLLLRLAERHDLALAFLRRPDEEPIDPELAALCARLEEVALPAPGALPGLRRRTRLATGLARGRPMWASELTRGATGDRIAALARAWRPEVIHVELRVAGLFLPTRGVCPARRILVDHDPPAATSRDLARAAHGPERLLHALDARAWARVERTTTAAVDAVVTLTDHDRRAVAASAPERRVVRIPPCIDVPRRPADPGGAEPAQILFVGGFGHLPNVDAAVRLARSVLPRIRARRPDATLQLVGRDPPRRVRALASHAVIVRGEVDDVASCLARAAVLLAPIRTGGGVRVKLLEALAAGTAVVTTPRGAQGLESAAGHALVVADSDAALAAAVVGLLDDPLRRVALGAAARRWAATELDWNATVAGYEALYDELLGL